MPSFRKPSEQAVVAFLDAQRRQSYSYSEVGASRDQAPAGYVVDHNRVCLGSGQAVFDVACAALRRWEMFPSPWTQVLPAQAPLREGEVVAVRARVFGTWWLNACRIIYTIDESAPLRRFGFAYGTLPCHVEQGEERFSIEWDPEDRVWYDLWAFSRPRHWLARLSHALTRRLQKRFARESLAAMRRAVEKAATESSASP